MVMKKYLSHFPLLIACVLCISVVLNLYLGYHHWLEYQQSRDKAIETSSKYPLLSPRIFAEQKNDVLINFLPLRNALREYAMGFDGALGIYFEYLPSGTSIGINEKKDFIAASLIKVPVVMAFFRQQEVTGLDQMGSVVRLEASDMDKGFGKLWERGVGTEVSYDDLIRLTLVDSDNTAVLAISRNVHEQYFEEVYQGLDVDFIKQNDRLIVSPKEYASILKSLYLSAVISKASSQKILTYLTEHSSYDKLVDGVPQGVPVANKFGMYQEGAVHQDCGIVYVPKRPYILCIMSESSEQEARERIRMVSQKVYQFVANVNTNVQ